MYQIEKQVTRFEEPSIWILVHGQTSLDKSSAIANLKWFRHESPDIKFRKRKVG